MHMLGIQIALRLVLLSCPRIVHLTSCQGQSRVHSLAIRHRPTRANTSWHAQWRQRCAVSVQRRISCSSVSGPVIACSPTFRPPITGCTPNHCPHCGPAYPVCSGISRWRGGGCAAGVAERRCVARVSAVDPTATHTQYGVVCGWACTGGRRHAAARITHRPPVPLSLVRSNYVSVQLTLWQRPCRRCVD
jgi:hypothetical protein